MKMDFNVKKVVKQISLSAASGVLAGVAATIFLYLLSWATNYREENKVIIWALPIAGLAIGWFYHRYGKHVVAGNHLILDEIHDPKKTIPFRMAPFILFGTVATHLFGGSAGREGTAVQMGASLSDQLSKIFKLTVQERKNLLVAGAGAGFGAAIGAPWAGSLFGMEVLHIGRIKPIAVVESIIASFVAYYTSLFLHAPHTKYPAIFIPNVDLRLIFFVAIAGVIFGVTAKLFIYMAHYIEILQSRFVRYLPLRPFIAGLVLIVLYYIENAHHFVGATHSANLIGMDGAYRFAGLGLPVIQNALVEPTHFYDPFVKMFFTAITVGSGFKGGEFIPLVFIGTTLGSALALFLPVSFQLLAGCGFAAVFAGAANTPLACSIMAIEIFGLPIAPYVLVACYASYYFSGFKGIYKTQKITGKKIW